MGYNNGMELHACPQYSFFDSDHLVFAYIHNRIQIDYTAKERK